MNSTGEFLDKVITSPKGQLVLCSRNHTVEWSQEFHLWPDDRGKVLSRIEFLKDQYDLYFSAHLFSQPDAAKINVLPSYTIQADLDNAELESIQLEPSVLVETSPKRYQAYWIINQTTQTTPEQLEKLSKRVTYSINNADHTGWSLGHRLRIPGTLNFKYNNGPHEVKIVSAGLHTYLPEEIELLPVIQPQLLTIFDNDFMEKASTITNDLGPMQIMQNLKDKVPHTTYLDYINNQVSSDRSAALWSLMCSLFEAGMSREVVFWLAKHSKNNKFTADVRYNADRELAKDVQRAEQHVKIKPVDMRSIIDDARSMVTPNIPGGALQKRRLIMSTVHSAMLMSGKFIRASAGLSYFIPNDSGRPIVLSHGSEQLRAMLNLRYGLNAADPEYKYIHSGILDLGVALEETVVEASLSYYTAHDNVMYFHTGRRDVLRITPNNVSNTINGEHGVLFPWHEMLEPFAPDMKYPYEGDWADVVFGDLHNTTNMQPAEAKALLKVWLIFSLFRSSVSTRPLLALFGPPSAGKSTIPHRIYALLYARRLAVLGLTNPQEFDAASTKLPVYCIDNLDTYVAWVLDKLAQAIGDMDILKRKLYTDVDVIRQRRQAMIVVTAHNPKFTREDVTSRLLLITLEEISGKMMANETDMINSIVMNRPKLWGAILHDVATVLGTPRPHESTVKWRIQDFASLGEWIAIALDVQDDFNKGLRSLLGTQSDTLLQQDEILVSAIKNYVTYQKESKGMPINELWNALLTSASDEKAFLKVYRNAQRLSHKLTTMKSTLQYVANIYTTVDHATRTILWHIEVKDDTKEN